MLDVVIDRTKWARGNGLGNGLLLNVENGKMCCLGFACISADIPEGFIMGRGDIDTAFTDGGEPESLDALVVLTNGGFIPSSIHGNLVTENDREYVDDLKREKTIIEYGLQAGINFSFVN